MNEKDIPRDIPGRIIPFRPRNKTDLPTIVFESSPDNSDSNVINLTAVKPKPPSNVVILSSKRNLTQILDTAQSAIAVEGEGAKILLDNVTDGVETIGEVTMEVESIPLPEILQARRKGIIRNKTGAIAWLEGGDRVLITSIHAPTNPITGKRLILPAQTPIQTTAAENPASHLSSGNVVPQNNDSLRTFIRPLTDAELKKPA